jgi:serine/threonine protein kinase
MLEHNLGDSEESSLPPLTPHRRLTHDSLGPGIETPPRPPPGSEFIGSSPAPQTPTGISSKAFSQNYFHRFFQEERELGRGGKGVVLLVKHVLDGVSLGHFALKRIPVGDDHQWLEKVLIEVQLLQHLSHQNLVSYRHVWLENFQISKFGPSVPCAFVLQQYCNSGDLHSYVLQGMETTTTKEQLKERIRRKSRHEDDALEPITSPRRLSFDEIRAFFKDITAGINHLHANNYIHRDLKPSNCLLHDSGKGLRVLVSDFGEVQTESQVRNSSGSTGTISYCAPEVLRMDPTTGQLGNFTTKSDIFSLGLILYFMSFARLPYSNSDNLHEENEDIDLLREEILAWAGVDDNDNSRFGLPDKLFKFLGRLLSLDPNERPTSEETLQAIKIGAGIEGFSERSRSTEGVRRRSKFSPFESDSHTESSGSRRFSRDLSRSTPPSNLDLSPRRRASQHEPMVIDPSLSPSPDDDEQAATPSGSLILRSRHTSPTKASASPERLPEPQPHRGFVATPEFLYTLKIACLLFKIFSIYFLCQPVATRPDVGLALLGLATVDLLWPGSPWGIVLGLLGLHMALVYAAREAEMLCLPRGSLWEEI